METKYFVRVITDTILLLIVGGCIFVVKKVWSPFERGMFCNDKSISYPFTDHETVSDTVLLLFGVAMPAVLMILLEGWRAKHNLVGKSIHIFNRRTPSWLWACYTTIGVFLFGCACSQLTTDIAKYSVGRLRPHFVSVCKPDWSKIDCNQTYVDPIPCTSDDAHRMKEARLSFPSGHASFSAFTMVYLVARFVSDLFTSLPPASPHKQGLPVYLQERRIHEGDSEANNTINTSRNQTAIGTVSE